MSAPGHDMAARNAKLASDAAFEARQADRWHAIAAEHAKELAAAQAQLADVAKERDEAVASKDHTQAWYATRWQKLKDWARAQGGQVADDFFSIVANGDVLHGDGQKWSYGALLNLEKFAKERAEQRLADVARDNERLRGALRWVKERESSNAQIIERIDAALAHPAPAAVEQARTERELRDAAMELAEYYHQTTCELHENWTEPPDSLLRTYRAIRDQRAAAGPAREGR